MGLRDLRTDLKSLRYSGDTLGGGTSNQPYIKAKIPDGFNNLQNANNDFILRGGILAARDSAVDILRLGKMFTDTKSPSGLLFIAKQQLLSRIAVRTQTSGRLLNEGVYSPLSTLAQAGVVAFGGHLNKQGINPFAGTGAFSNNDSLYGVRVKYNQPAEENRLALLANTKIDFKPIRLANGVILNDGVNVMTYPGGPGAPLGIGKTGIRYASPEQLTGLSNIKNSTGQFFGPLTWTPKQNSSLGIPIFGNFELNQSNPVYNVYNNVTGSITSTQYVNSLDIGSENALLTDNTTMPGVLGNELFNQNTFTYTQTEIQNEVPNYLGSPSIQDFRKKIRANLGSKPLQDNAESSGATPITPDYQDKNLEKRTNIGGTVGGKSSGGGPGNKTNKNLISYTNGSGIGPIDRINALNLYSSTQVTTNDVKNDLVKFRIAAIDNKKPTSKTFMHFRAFIDNFSDSYNATWNPINYLGRGESFYTYNGFTRTISLGWTVAAQSKEELMPMYRKLNYLASNLTPDYTGKGYMTGNLVQLTIGGYLYEQVGFINSLTYDVPAESPWEIGINDVGEYDPTTKEMPHILRVTGFSFTPIHDFIPSKQTIGVDTGGNVNLFGLQKYIALSNTEDTGANDGYSYINPDVNVVPPQVIPKQVQPLNVSVGGPQRAGMPTLGGITPTFTG
jgi:hypothetical protein